MKALHCSHYERSGPICSPRSLLAAGRALNNAKNVHLEHKHSTPTHSTPVSKAGLTPNLGWLPQPLLYCGVVLADLSKAFDRVLHGQLIECLQEIEVGGTVLLWLISYLTNRQQMVKLPTKLGRKFYCSRGVPQGSVL